MSARGTARKHGVEWRRVQVVAAAITSLPTGPDAVDHETAVKALRALKRLDAQIAQGGRSAA